MEHAWTMMDLRPQWGTTPETRTHQMQGVEPVSTLSSFWREHITNLHRHNEVSRLRGFGSDASGVR
jgi:hypothetical protein